MKLNLVADYDINGKRMVRSFAIDGSNNLVRLTSLTSQLVPTTDGGFAEVAPKTLHMCESGKKAEEVAREWEEQYRKDGRLYDFRPIDRSAVGKTAA